jgi:hypothetical protein
LFLPFILGLASFKKILGFAALVIPGLIGFFKLCKPNLQSSYGNYGHSNFYSQPPVSSSYPYYGGSGSAGAYAGSYPGGGGGSFYGRDTNNLQAAASVASSSQVAFRDPDTRDPHQIAYQGYPQYQ